MPEELSMIALAQHAEAGHGNKYLAECYCCENPADSSLLEQAILQTQDAVLITSDSGKILFVNPAFEKDTGYTTTEVLGQTPSVLKSGEHPPEFYALLWKTLRKGSVFRGVFVNRRKNGRLYHEEKTITPIRNRQGAITHFVSTGRDVSERIAAQQRMEHLANYDVLTGLPNRSLFLDRLRHAIDRCQRDKTIPVLLYVDLDRFKTINDTLGHGAGDAVLMSVAARLRVVLRAQDTVARLGGDEFAIILEGVDGSEDGARVSDTLLRAFQKPFDIDGRTLYVGLSIGIACYPADGDDVESLVKHADIAMFHAKMSGRSSAVNFSAVMEGGMLDDLSMETSLHAALANEEFEVVYQPVVDPASAELVAVEALLRWHSPSHGTVPPSRFIPILEATGMIVEVGRWVLETACTEIKRLHGDHHGAAVLAVNISGRQFRDERMVAELAGVLQEVNFPADRLELEITESVLIENSSAALATLNSLKGLGVRLAIDDFGTGYSSLSYLRRFPIDTLKIDRSFVVEMENSPDAVVIVRAIVSLAHNLGLEVIGEGVETAGQLAILSEMGCRKVQGYWFSPPLTLKHLYDRCLQDPAAALASADGCQ